MIFVINFFSSFFFYVISFCWLVNCILYSFFPPFLYICTPFFMDIMFTFIYYFSPPFRNTKKKFRTILKKIILNRGSSGSRNVDTIELVRVGDGFYFFYFEPCFLSYFLCFCELIVMILACDDFHSFVFALIIKNTAHKAFNYSEYTSKSVIPCKRQTEKKISRHCACILILQ